VSEYYNLMTCKIKFLSFTHMPRIFLLKSKSRLISFRLPLDILASPTFLLITDIKSSFTLIISQSSLSLSLISLSLSLSLSPGSSAALISPPPTPSTPAAALISIFQAIFPSIGMLSPLSLSLSLSLSLYLSLSLSLSLSPSPDLFHS
jgi:hypothetical protein